MNAATEMSPITSGANASAGTPAIAIDAVSHWYGANDVGVKALDDVTIHLQAGRLGVLVGPSGCGKTTLLNLVAGFFRPAAGSVKVHGEEVDGAGPDRMVVFQDHALFAWMTVEQNILHGMYASKQLSRQQKRDRVHELIEVVGLQGFESSYPAQLSGGMRQRAGLARALAPSPSVLLLDEPFGALDAITREQLQDELVGILGQTKVTALLVTHSIDEAVYLGDEVFILSSRPGRVHSRWTRPDGVQFGDRSSSTYLEAIKELRHVFGSVIQDHSG